MRAYNGAKLAVCRAKAGDGVHPGHVTNSTCAVGWAGQTYSYAQFDVLVQK